MYKFKANDSGFEATLLFLGSISKDILVDNMKKTRLNGYVYVVDYDAIAVLIY